MSPIEIEYGEYLKKVVNLFIKKIILRFHLDWLHGDFK